MEGGSVDHVVRILSGEKLYVAPSLEFIPFVYTPLYFYISAAVSKMAGTGFLPLRLVSFISSLGCLVVIFLMVRKETQSSFWGAAASGLFAATYRVSGAWFDIARADSLFLFFFLVALYLIKFRESSKSYALAGLLVSLSFLTKQAALLMCLPITLYCLLLNRRRSIYFIGTVAILVGASTYLLNWIHHGWYYYYVFDLPGHHSIAKSMYLGFWTKDIISTLPVPAWMSIFYLFTRLSNSNLKDFLFYLLMLVGMLGGAWFSRLHAGGYDNVLIPAYAALSITFGLGAHAAFQFIRVAGAKKRRLIQVFLYSVCLIQFLALTYDPAAQVPTREDVEAGDAFIETMSQLPGNVYVPCHGYLPSLAGKTCCAHQMALVDVLRGKNCPAKTQLIQEIRQAVREKRFDAIIVDAAYIGPSWLLESIKKDYTGQTPVFHTRQGFWSVTGVRTRPQVIYLRNTTGSD